MRSYEDKYYNMGYGLIAGVDECGRGCLAGPVAAAAVILPRDFNLPGVNDSKKLTAKRREALYSEIMRRALAVGYAEVSADIIDKINILEAAKLAMAEAAAELMTAPEVILVDGNALPCFYDKSVKAEAVAGGDGKSVSIACASIVAKVLRDDLMLEYDSIYPGYGFGKHKAYGTKEHLAAIALRGTCPEHRLTFRFRGAGLK